MAAFQQSSPIRSIRVNNRKNGVQCLSLDKDMDNFNLVLLFFSIVAILHVDMDNSKGQRKFLKSSQFSKEIKKESEVSTSTQASLTTGNVCLIRHYEDQDMWLERSIVFKKQK